LEALTLARDGRRISVVVALFSMIKIGKKLTTLRDILDHVNLATTSRYLHTDAARMQEMVETL
jgi:site-specific recombinase XerD